MSCLKSGLWHFSTNANNDIFHILQVSVVTIEMVIIFFYARNNRNISVNSNIVDYEDTADDYSLNPKNEKLSKKVENAKNNSILPVYYSLLKWYIMYEFLMIMYSLCLFILSVNQIGINTITKYSIIFFEGFVANLFWYTFMYLIIWSFIQNSFGKNTWRRSAYLSIILGLLHGIVFVFIFLTIQILIITIAICVFDLLIFTCLIAYMFKYPNKRYQKSLIFYTLVITIIHIIYLLFNIIVLVYNIQWLSNHNQFCVYYVLYYIFDIIRQIIYPIILFFTLKYDSKYWSEMASIIMSSNHTRLSIVNMHSSFDNLAQMSIPIFDFRCLGMNDESSANYLGIGTSATVLLGTYKGNNVAIKCIICDELDIETMHLFYKEALLSLSLQLKGKSHPNIVKFLGIALQPPELCLIYEYCKHKSLTNVLQNVDLYSDINYIQILYIAKDIARGMKYLHKSGFLHRDLKTENILIHTYTCNKNDSTTKYPNKLYIAKICDFGLSRKVDYHENINPLHLQQQQQQLNDESELAQAQATSYHSFDESLSDSNSTQSKSSIYSVSSFLFGNNNNNEQKKKKILLSKKKQNKNKNNNYNPRLMTTEVGTVAFLPPEILQNVSFEDMGDVKILNKNCLYAQSMDVFSFGCIMWELIMRDEVYKEYKTAEDIRNAVLNGLYPKMPQWAPDNYTNLILACWEKNPFKRPTFKFINNKLTQIIADTNNYIT